MTYNVSFVVLSLYSLMLEKMHCHPLVKSRFFRTAFVAMCEGVSVLQNTVISSSCGYLPTYCQLRHLKLCRRPAMDFSAASFVVAYFTSDG